MLEWKVDKQSGNDRWINNLTEIVQIVHDNRIKYKVRCGGFDKQIFNTLQEAKQSCEPIEKPYEAGYFEERKWGSFTVLERGEGYLVKKLFIKKGCSISYQYHEHRSEDWIVLKGLGDFKTQFILNHYRWSGTIDGIYKTSGDIVTRYGAGSYIQINPNQYHKWTSVEDTEILEVWRGQDLRESDIVRLDN